MTDIRTLLQRTTRELTAGGSPSPRLDAEVLLMHFLKTDRLQLYMHPERELTEEECAGFSLWVERRRRGEPVAYITGEKEFWSLLFEVNRDVLIPRPETECLIEEVLKYYGREAGLCGSSISGREAARSAWFSRRRSPSALVTATDISRGALEVARRNADRHGVAGRMEFLEGHLFASAVGEFDVIVSNPPYIPDDVYLLLPEGIRAFEPREALIAGPDGAAFHREIIREGAGRLKPGGRIFLEIGEGQRELVESLFREAGCYTDIYFRKDYGGMERVVAARKISVREATRFPDVHFYPGNLSPRCCGLNGCRLIRQCAYKRMNDGQDGDRRGREARRRGPDQRRQERRAADPGLIASGRWMEYLSQHSRSHGYQDDQEASQKPRRGDGRGGDAPDQRRRDHQLRGLLRSGPDHAGLDPGARSPRGEDRERRGFPCREAAPSGRGR